ncbi:hypothetical protein Cgig2_021592 [Carnegiea gigantea]|uniref:Uncharacterized protein n=1 Tax=Carnegiea gigantea TaxID=171969 RepID=A0A9Q1GRG4_9CARY|nr:hypothetical protein Cgig2_021592 [Carnegiea gigantea]
MKELGSIARFIQEQGAPSSFLDQAAVKELCLPRKESRSCSEVSAARPSNKLPSAGEGSAVLHVSPIKKLQGREIKESKGKTSILRFLQRFEPSSLLDHEQNNVLQRNCTPSSPEWNSQRRESWNYNIDKIDPTIIDELPPDIQEELRVWMRPTKQPHSSKRSITSYFSPMKGAG